MTTRELLSVKIYELAELQGKIAEAQYKMSDAEEVFKNEGFEEASDTLEDIWETLHQVRRKMNKFLEYRVDTEIGEE